MVLLATAIFLYLQLFILPAIPRVAVGEQSIYLHSAARMDAGQLIYRDYDQFTFPGTDVLYLCLFKLVGQKAWIPQLMLLLAGVVSMWLSIVIASKVLKGPRVFLPGFLFLTLPYSSYLDATHHLYNVLAATTALAIVMEGRTGVRIALAGILWALATFFAQSLVLGALGFAMFLVWEEGQANGHWKKLLPAQALLWGPYVATLLAFNGYFLWKVRLQHFTYYTAVFLFKYFPSYKIGSWSTYLRGWPSIHKSTSWPDLPAWPFIHALVPLVYLAFLLIYWKRTGRERRNQWHSLVLINTMGFSLFLTIASRPSWNRVYTVSLPALIVFVWLLNAPSPANDLLRRLLWATVLVLAIVRPVVTQVRWRGLPNLPTGPQLSSTQVRTKRQSGCRRGRGPATIFLEINCYASI